MGVVKRSVSVDAELWDDLVREAGDAAVSPLVNDALAHYLRRQRGLAAMAAYEAEHGEFSEAELAEADRILDAAGVTDVGGPATQPRERPATTKRQSRARSRA